MAATMRAMTLLAAFTALLAVLATARLTRLVVADDIGLWYVRGPAALWAVEREAPLSEVPEPDRGDEEDAVDLREALSPALGWRSRLVSGLSCPFCVGFWIGVLVLLSLALVGGPSSDSTAADVWRWVAAPFALNYVVAHVGARLGDTDED